MDINQNITIEIAKKILGNKDQATPFLFELTKKTELVLPFKTMTRRPNKGKKRWTSSADELYLRVTENWHYNNGKTIIRELFKKTIKYKRGKKSFDLRNKLLREWQKLNFGEVEWPFSQGQFDGYVQSLNSENSTSHQKDKKVKESSVKYRRIKELNTLRNDFIETLIFEKHNNIIPTLSHRRSVDFFINGISFDQKVAKSPTDEFKKDFGVEWKDQAIAHPEKVAEYLYKLQDEGRFGTENRLLVVYLDEEVNFERISEIIEATDLTIPLKVKFTFNHKTGGNVDYDVECFVILLYN